MNAYPLEIIRGDDVAIPLTVRIDDKPFDLTGSLVYFTVKLKSVIGNNDLDDKNALFQVVTSSHVDAKNGSTIIEIPSEFTNRAQISEASYVYDIQIVDASGKRTTIAPKAQIRFFVDVTRS